MWHPSEDDSTEELLADLLYWVGELRKNAAYVLTHHDDYTERELALFSITYNAWAGMSIEIAVELIRRGADLDWREVTKAFLKGGAATAAEWRGD